MLRGSSHSSVISYASIQCVPVKMAWSALSMRLDKTISITYGCYCMNRLFSHYNKCISPATVALVVSRSSQNIMRPPPPSQQLLLAGIALRAGRSENRIPVWARFFAPFQTGQGAHPAPYTMGNRSLSQG
jgi:hypothetical protein